MKKQILQIENVDNLQFQKELIKEFKRIVENLDNKLTAKYTDVLLTREETAKMLSISLVTLWKYTKSGVLPAHRIGSKIRYKKEEVLQALQQANNFQ